MANELIAGNQRLGLAGIPLFRQLSPDALEKISGLMAKVVFKAGDVNFLQREPGDSLYVIDSGSVCIWVRDRESNEVTRSYRFWAVDCDVTGLGGKRRRDAMMVHIQPREHLVIARDEYLRLN